MDAMLDTFVCDAQGCYLGDRAADYDEDSETLKCPRCGGAASVSGERPTKWASVAVYETYSQYGGPEEGGWWYDCGRVIPETIRSYTDQDWKEMEDYILLLRSRYPGPDISLRVLQEQAAVQSFPTTTPRYS